MHMLRSTKYLWTVIKKTRRANARRQKCFWYLTNRYHLDTNFLTQLVTYMR